MITLKTFGIHVPADVLIPTTLYNNKYLNVCIFQNERDMLKFAVFHNKATKEFDSFVEAMNCALEYEIWFE